MLSSPHSSLLSYLLYPLLASISYIAFFLGTLAGTLVPYTKDNDTGSQSQGPYSEHVKQHPNTQSNYPIPSMSRCVILTTLLTINGNTNDHLTFTAKMAIL